MPGQRVRAARDQPAPARAPPAALAARLLPDAAAAARGATLTDLCANCSRPLFVDGSLSTVNDHSASYCGHNCRWTAMLDPSGSRHRRAKRAAAAAHAKPRRRRREPLVLDDDDDAPPAADAAAVDDDAFGGTGGNALFDLFCNFGAGVSPHDVAPIALARPLRARSNVNASS